MSPAKTAKAIEMPFASRTRVGSGKHLLHIADRFEANTVLCPVSCSSRGGGSLNLALSGISTDPSFSNPFVSSCRYASDPLCVPQ